MRVLLTLASGRCLPSSRITSALVRSYFAIFLSLFHLCIKERNYLNRVIINTRFTMELS